MGVAEILALIALLISATSLWYARRSIHVAERAARVAEQSAEQDRRDRISMRRVGFGRSGRPEGIIKLSLQNEHPDAPWLIRAGGLRITADELTDDDRRDIETDLRLRSPSDDLIIVRPKSAPNFPLITRDGQSAGARLIAPRLHTLGVSKVGLTPWAEDMNGDVSMGDSVVWKVTADWIEP